MLAYCWVIIDDVDPQLRQRLVLAECSTGKFILITRVCLLTLNIMTNLLRKIIYVFLLDINVGVINEEYD